MCAVWWQCIKTINVKIHKTSFKTIHVVVFTLICWKLLSSPVAAGPDPAELPPGVRSRPSSARRSCRSPDGSKHLYSLQPSHSCRLYSGCSAEKLFVWFHTNDDCNLKISALILYQQYIFYLMRMTPPTGHLHQMVCFSFSCKFNSFNHHAADKTWKVTETTFSTKYVPSEKLP